MKRLSKEMVKQSMANNLKQWLGIPAIIVGTILSIGTIMGWFGFKVATPTDTLQNHIVEEEQFESEVAGVHASYDSIHSIQQVTMDEKYDTLHTELHEQKTLAEALILRVCIQDSYHDLQLQRLVGKCRDLGVVREPNRPAPGSSGP